MYRHFKRLWLGFRTEQIILLIINLTIYLAVILESSQIKYTYKVLWKKRDNGVPKIRSKTLHDLLHEAPVNRPSLSVQGPIITDLTLWYLKKTE